MIVSRDRKGVPIARATKGDEKPAAPQRIADLDRLSDGFVTEPRPRGSRFYRAATKPSHAPVVFSNCMRAFCEICIIV